MTRGLFTGIATVYDRMNHLLSLGLDRHWRRKAAECARGRPSKILDLACGTGDFAFELAVRFADAEVVGVDFTPAMLEIARRKNASARVSFHEGDAHDLSRFGDGAFGLCSCAFGFRNFADRRKVLAEIRRALVPGGELLVLEFFRPANAALGVLVSAWVWFAAAVFSRGKAGSYRYLRESIWRMDSVESFVATAGECGLSLASRQLMPPSCTCLRFVARAVSGDVGGEYAGRTGGLRG